MGIVFLLFMQICGPGCVFGMFKARVKRLKKGTGQQFGIDNANREYGAMLNKQTTSGGINAQIKTGI